MEKRIWSKPEMNEFAFAANEYVAACGDGGTVYKFICNAARDLPSWLDWGGKVYQETNEQDGLQETGDQCDTYLGEYHSCSKTHEASKLDEFLFGWFKPTGLILDTDPKQVVIWRGEEGNNIHCTTNLDMEKWETAKS